MNPELQRRIQMGQLHHQQRLPPEKRPVFDRTDVNPLPPTNEGAAVLRQLYNCPMVSLMKSLDTALRQALDRRDVSEATRLSNGTRACVVADLVCMQNLNTRTAVRFKDDEELMAMTQQLEVIALEATSLQAHLEQLSLSYNALEDERFQKAVARYGLNVKERIYQINEKEASIELIEPKCPECEPVNSLKDLLAPKSQEEKALRSV
jgi:hypothetical protein